MTGAAVTGDTSDRWLNGVEGLYGSGEGIAMLVFILFLLFGFA